MASASKGFVVGEHFWVIIILLLMVFLLAVWIILNFFFIDYVKENINSQKKFCETFQKVPLFGTIRCPT